MIDKPLKSGTYAALDLSFQARVSRSMASNLMAAFEGRSESDCLILESRDFGLWVVDPGSGGRMFIGSTTVRNNDVKH